MANWAYTSYAIEGPEELLEKIRKAIIDHPVSEGADEHWEGDILNALDCKWVSRNDNRENGKYMRGFIRDEPWWHDDEHTALRFSAEEAWGVTDFDEVLEENFSDVKVYWTTEEEGMGVYKTNDKEGKYFIDRVYVDTCINDNYQSDYFTNEKDAWEWLSKLTDDKVKTEKDADRFNEDAEEKSSDDYIYVHIFKVTD